MTERVTLFEVGPRDGLQNEPHLISTKDKIGLIDLLSECGFAKIEVTSFVSPKWVPQMANASEVFAGITRNNGCVYSALTPNRRGFDAALAAGVDEIAIFAAASETFSQRNINCSIAESLDRFQTVTQAAKSAGIPVRGYVSCVTDCPYEGAILPEQAALVAHRLLEMGCYEVSLGDTIGHATPQSTNALLTAVLSHAAPNQLAGHFHDTKGRALENIEASLARGLRTFDSSVAGLGGCPFAPGASGNVATEAVVARLATLGFETGIDPEKLSRASAFASKLKSVA